MVKFSKELEAQLIPEWKEAFVNYCLLKKQIKKIKTSRKPKPASHYPIAQHSDFGRSLFDPVRKLARTFSDKLFSNSEKPEILQVRRRRNSSENGDDVDEIYQTELVQLFSEEDEVKVFFARLDEELNKVNQFHKAKETEFLGRGEILKKQLEILAELKQILSDRKKRNLSGSNSHRSFSSSARNSDFSAGSPGDLSEIQSETSRTDEIIEALERNGVSFINSATRSKTKGGKPKMSLRVDIPDAVAGAEGGAARSIATATSVLWEELVNNPRGGGGDFINRKKIQCAEKMIRSAFVELYRGLGLLKTYSSLNMIAFTKIMKKFDKVAGQNASSTYLKVVKRSQFISSDKVVRLMDEVESIFTKHFANNDRKKAMKFLKPHQTKDSHMVTFFVGLFTGCFISLFSIYIILAHLSGIFTSSAQVSYMETVYPVFSVFALLSLHMFMYGCNLFMWKNTRINYTFIFEFAPNTALRYRDAFLMGTTFMTSVVAAMVIHLLLRAGGFSASQVDTIPGILLLIFICVLICPFDTFYRPTRFCFIRILRNIVCSPFYKVLMVDFFMADQLTSQIPLLRHLESTGCYFLAQSFKTHEYNTCKNGRIYRELAYLISFSPYFWRAMQCIRRWWDESNPDHLINMGKYVSAMVAAGVRITYARETTDLWLTVVLVSSVVATIYQLYWDFVKDWGLLNPKSKNPWLRDNLVLRNKNFYYFSIALNLVLRVAWIETIMRFRVSPVQSHLLDFLLASLEVIRRGHWNFYRVENEHLNNVGQFRAVKTVPLPFRDMDSDG
ncbi:phosphate transporter PHO1 [Arabidopsis lyrata subsp. lyrata]|uniref:phosphate transporter PHO1 n=1 Tax=Arabidopsis lyrata subsp. lyrata TaxID=81972 RepID=UPI000A29B2F0|nr:phosphate transporter PHO1 [Arabidopsis lyrata subsp. lyrata]|eukprot:XP_020887661.1 phosphate transporter PHO1 [Arabidopsis lyrata subsp. lyrata]